MACRFFQTRFFPALRLLPKAVAHACFFLSLTFTPCALVSPACAAQKETEGQRISQARASMGAAGDSLAGNFLAGIVADAERDNSFAELYLGAALAADPSNENLRNEIFFNAIGSGAMDKASAIGKSLFATKKHNALVTLFTGLEALKNKDYAKAHRLLLEAGSKGQTRDLTSVLLSGWALIGLGKTGEALSVLDILQDPHMGAFKHYMSALMEHYAHHENAAAAHFEAALKGDGATARLYEAYARFLSRTGDHDKAIVLLRQFFAAHPEHPTLAALYKTIKDNKPVSDIVASPADGAGELLFALGATSGRANDVVISQIFLRLALYLEPHNEAATTALAETLELSKQNDSAIELYKTIASASELYPYAQIQIAQLLDGKDDETAKREAMSILTRLIDTGNATAESWSALGTLQRERKLYLDAIASYGHAIALLEKPKAQDWFVFYARGVSYERTGQWEHAEADFTKALELQPDQPLVLNYLGYSYIDRNLHLDKALEMLKRAVELNPDDGYIIDSRGWAYYKLGNMDSALADIEHAISIKPTDPTINDHLGDVYWKLGRRREAQFQWSHARDFKPEPEDLPKILQKLANGLENVDTHAQNPSAIPLPTQQQQTNDKTVQPN